MSTWPSCIVRYDGTFAGFLTSTDACIHDRIYPYYFFTPQETQTTLQPLREISTHPDRAKRMYRTLREKFSPEFQKLIAYGFLTCLPQKERRLFDLIYLGFVSHLPRDPTDERVLVITKAVGHLTREAHLLKGFVRFSDYNGILVGQISPENQVLPLLRPHFCQRLPEESFLLHDRTHGEGLFYSQHHWEIRPVEFLELNQPTQTEQNCQALWQAFYDTITIPSRYNPKLRMSHMPKRYWENMTEMKSQL